MNRGLTLAAAVVAAALLGARAAPAAPGDGDIQQQLIIEQQRSSFAAKLERLRDEARERGPRPRDAHAGRADIGVPARSYQSMRLEPLPVPERLPPEDAAADLPSARNQPPDLREQAVHAQQRHRVLSSEIRSSGEPRYERYWSDRYELNRARTLQQRSNFQRKLAP